MDGTTPDDLRPNRSISDLYAACRDSVDQYRKDRAKSEESLFETLGRALELYRYSEEADLHKDELKKLLAEHKIRITKRTKNPFTPIVKLVFEGEIIETEKSLVMRCAGILRLAGVSFFGRFEGDLLLDPRIHTTRYKRRTLRGLGLKREASNPVVVFHAHLIAYHPNLSRGRLALLLKQRIPGFRRTETSPLSGKQPQAEALDNLTRYVVKSRPPKAALFGRGSRLCRPANPKALRLHNKLIIALNGKNGECIIS